jgi:hypothetical protein
MSAAAEPWGLLARAVDLLRRADPAWCAAHEVAQPDDAEWDATLTVLEDALEDAGAGAGLEPVKPETVESVAIVSALTTTD